MLEGIIIYNKLVRDKIPEIIGKENNISEIEMLNKEDHLKYLYLKLNEEVFEFQEKYELEELADILEVIDGILEIRKVSNEEINELKIKKKSERGGFSKGILLKSVAETKKRLA